MTGRLIQISGVIVDHIYWVDALPAAGSEALVCRSRLCAGGGFNAMAAARRAGMQVTYYGTLGTGPFADIAADALAAEGIQTPRPRLPGLDQGCCTVLIDNKGERTFIASEGADGVMTDADLASIDPGPADILILSGYALGYRASCGSLTRWLLTNPPNLLWDPSPLVAQIPGETRAAALNAAAWISANSVEAAFLTGHTNPAKSAGALSDRPGGAIVRDGANGCYMALPGQPTRHIPGYPVRAIDTNGAGDAHIGAFIAALSRGENPAEAARLANMAAALSTTIEGPSTAPTLAQAMAALAAPIPQHRRRP